MILVAIALWQATTSPPPPADSTASPFRVVTKDDGSAALVIDRAAAADRDALEEKLAEEAARQCGTATLDLGEFSYNQAIDGDGNPAPDMTEISQAFRCGNAQPAMIAPLVPENVPK